MSDDIALVRIKFDDNGNDIVFSSHVQPACLPAANEVHTAGTKCLLSGWGSIYNGEYL